MALKTISYTVDTAGIDPAKQQNGGMQGSHNAYRITFTLADGLTTALQNELTAHEGTRLLYRFDGHSGSGLVQSTEPETLDLIDEPVTLSYDLERWITEDGGNILVYLVITLVSGSGAEEETVMEWFSRPAKIPVGQIPAGQDGTIDRVQSVTVLYDRVVALAQGAEDAKVQAESYASAASTDATAARNAASEAGLSAYNAGSYSQAAAQAAAEAQTAASGAGEAATSAEASAQSAESSAASAQASAGQASTSATQAGASSAAAAASAAAAETSAEEAAASEEKTKNSLQGLQIRTNQLFDANDYEMSRWAYRVNTGDIVANALSRSVVVKVPVESGKRYTAEALGDFSEMINSMSSVYLLSFAEEPIAGAVPVDVSSIRGMANDRIFAAITASAQAEYLVFSLNFKTGSDSSKRDEIAAEYFKKLMLAQSDSGFQKYKPYYEFSVVRLFQKVSLSVGENLITDITAGDGWSQTAEGYQHTAESEDPLIADIGAAAGKSYLLEFDYTGKIDLFGFTVSIGGSYEVDVYNGTPHVQVGIKAPASGALVITPFSSYLGTVSNIVCREIVDNGTPVEIQNDNFRYIDGANEITGFWNVAIGPDALKENVNGSRNIAIGKSALLALVTGTRNLAYGTYVFPQLENGDGNIGIGADAGLYIQTAEESVLIGKAAGGKLHSSQKDIAIGRCALYGADKDTSAPSQNIAIGENAGYNVTTANQNILIGKNAGYHISTGLRNIVIGNNAIATNLKTSQDIILIGAGTNLLSDGFTKSTAIGFQAVITKSNQTVIGGSNNTETLVHGKILFDENGTIREVASKDDIIALTHITGDTFSVHPGLEDGSYLCEQDARIETLIITSGGQQPNITSYVIPHGTVVNVATEKNENMAITVDGFLCNLCTKILSTSYAFKNDLATEPLTGVYKYTYFTKVSDGSVVKSDEATFLEYAYKPDVDAKQDKFMDVEEGQGGAWYGEVDNGLYVDATDSSSKHGALAVTPDVSVLGSQGDVRLVAHYDTPQYAPTIDNGECTFLEVKDGLIHVGGNSDLGGEYFINIRGVGTPIVDEDAANKAYVDTLFNSIVNGDEVNY